MLRLFQFVILTLSLALVALTSAIVTMRFAIHGAEVKIPSFQGLTAQQAQAKAAELGVEMTIDNRFYSAEVPAGRILSQSPRPAPSSAANGTSAASKASARKPSPSPTSLASPSARPSSRSAASASKSAPSSA